MSRRRKNAGEGYGYMFHGAFSEKADAVKKERKTKGAFIKGTPTRAGYRYIVMSPRLNPIKRKKKRETKAEVLKRRLAELKETDRTRTSNPSELLVMAANPGGREITVPPGTTITIRTNPAAMTLANPQNPLPYFGFGPASSAERERQRSYVRIGREARSTPGEGTAALRNEVAEALAGLGYKKSAARRAARGASGKDFNSLFLDAQSRIRASNPICGAMVGGEPCTRKPGHRGPHLPQGATMRPTSRLRRGWKPVRNPSAAAIREDFTGMPAEWVTVQDEPHMPAGDYAQLGKLLALYVKPHKGGQVQTIRGRDVMVLSDESARQIWFAGGDQDIHSALDIFGARQRGPGLFELGQARRIDYKQRKEHVPHPDKGDEWRHEFGEETGDLPIVLFDANKSRLLLEGGAYEIRPEGIVN
jgi:hypothetical protein